MKITAGTYQIPAHGIIEGSGGVQGVMCDTVQIMLPGLPDVDTMTAIMTNDIHTDDGRTLAGYRGLAAVQLTLYREPQDAKDLAMQQMTARMEAQAQAQREAVAAKDKAITEAEQAQQEATRAQAQASAKTALLMAVAEALPDELAAKHPEIYPELTQSGEAVPANHRIRWGDQVAKAKVALWDREDQDPDHAPELWDILTFGESGYREIPEVITAELAFAKGEIGTWKGKNYRAKRDGVVHNPDVYPADWEAV